MSLAKSKLGQSNSSEFIASAGGGTPDLWCASFTSWLYNKIGMPLVDDNGDASTGTIRTWAMKQGIWRDHGTAASGGYVPKPGDPIGFKNSRNSAPINHIGIVESYDPATKTVTTIEGNSNSKVSRRTYKIDDPVIVGFVDAFGAGGAKPLPKAA